MPETKNMSNKKTRCILAQFEEAVTVERDDKLEERLKILRTEVSVFHLRQSSTNESSHPCCMDCNDEELVQRMDANSLVFMAKSQVDELGYGIFARKHLPPHMFLGDYVGVLDTKPDNSTLLWPYTLTLESPAVSITAVNKTGEVMCLTALINHACEPNANCKFQDDNGRAWVETTRHVGPGEELLCDYGSEYFVDVKKRKPSICDHVGTSRTRSKPFVQKDLETLECPLCTLRYQRRVMRLHVKNCK